MKNKRRDGIDLAIFEKLCEQREKKIELFMDEVKQLMMKHKMRILTNSDCDGIEHFFTFLDEEDNSHIGIFSCTHFIKSFEDYFSELIGELKC